jgi:hypothetical protein
MTPQWRQLLNVNNFGGEISLKGNREKDQQIKLRWKLTHQLKPIVQVYRGFCVQFLAWKTFLFPTVSRLVLGLTQWILEAVTSGETR